MENNLTPLQKTAATRKLLEADIIARAWADKAFRAKLETDPVTALKEAGFPLPEGKTIRVISESPGALEIVLPAAPSVEASDEELASVAGGGIIDKGKCEAWEKEDAKQDPLVSGLGKTAVVICGIFGVSWGYG